MMGGPDDRPDSRSSSSSVAMRGLDIEKGWSRPDNRVKVLERELRWERQRLSLAEGEGGESRIGIRRVPDETVSRTDRSAVCASSSLPQWAHVPDVLANYLTILISCFLPSRLDAGRLFCPHL